MPQSAQHSLIQIILLWITILTIVQVVFIALFFTAGHHGLSQNKSSVAPEAMLSTANRTSSISENGLLQGKGKMLTFKGTGGNRTVKWEPKNPSKNLISAEEEVLTIEKDGYYFLNLQITLKGCKDSPLPKNLTEPIVTVMWKNKTVLLKGSINKNTCSTGLLARVTELSAGGTLVVNINMETPNIDEEEYSTHLDIIYISSSF